MDRQKIGIICVEFCYVVIFLISTYLKYFLNEQQENKDFRLFVLIKYNYLVINSFHYVTAIHPVLPIMVHFKSLVSTYKAI